jgi:tRNA A-37 threonylcarbamoyl transferase component Bud32
MANGFRSWIKDNKCSGIHIYGPLKDEFAPAIYSLLNGDLPNKWEWVKSSPNSVVARGLDPPAAYYKEYLKRSPLEIFIGLFRGSRCKRARVKREKLIKIGFHSPAIYCWGKKKLRNFMVTEGIDALGLGIYINQNWHPPLSKEKIYAKRMILKKLGQEIGRLHKFGIYHGDLRLNNILLEQKKEEIKFYFIDNERNYTFKKIPRRLIEKNLVQVNMVFPLYVTRQDRLRFFKAYSSVYHRFTGIEAIRLLEKVQKRTIERLTKVARRLRKKKGYTFASIHDDKKDP